MLREFSEAKLGHQGGHHTPARFCTESSSDPIEFKNANLTLSNRETAFILVMKQAAFAEAGAAIITTELISVSNVIPAFAAFYGSVDELKHQTFRIQSQRFKRCENDRFMRFNRCGLARFHRVQQ
jgi:hypothetical protein